MNAVFDTRFKRVVLTPMTYKCPPVIHIVYITIKAELSMEPRRQTESSRLVTYCGIFPTHDSHAESSRLVASCGILPTRDVMRNPPDSWRHAESTRLVASRGIILTRGVTRIPPGSWRHTEFFRLQGAVENPWLHF